MQNLEKNIESWDQKVIDYTKLWFLPFSRFAIFAIYFWFGVLKLFGNSPLNPLVAELLVKTLHGVAFPSFIIALGVFEIIIAFSFIIPNMQRLGIFLLIIHLITTIMPLFLLPAITWQGFLTPTLEGQYIIKNILVIALAIGILAEMNPLDERPNRIGSEYVKALHCGDADRQHG